MPELPPSRKISIDEGEKKVVDELLDALVVPDDEKTLMLGVAEALPERFELKRKRLESLGLVIDEECGEQNVVSIHVPDGLVLNSPIFLLEISVCAVRPHRSIRLEIGRNSDVAFVLGSPIPHVSDVTPLRSEVKVEAEQGSKSRLVIFHSYFDSFDADASFTAHLAPDSEMNVSVLTLKAGRILRIVGDVDVAENSYFCMSETSFLQGHSRKASWIHTKLHGSQSRAKLTSSDFNFDSSEAKTAFFIEVMKGASGASGSIFSNGLNFSEDARQMFLPGLVTHEDEVDLHHGASSGKWTPEQIEYLRSRGLDFNEIAKLLVDSLLGKSVYPRLTDRLKDYTRCCIDRIFRNRSIVF